MSIRSMLLLLPLLLSVYAGICHGRRCLLTRACTCPVRTCMCCSCRKGNDGHWLLFRIGLHNMNLNMRKMSEWILHALVLSAVVFWITYGAFESTGVQWDREYVCALPASCLIMRVMCAVLCCAVRCAAARLMAAV